MSTCLCACVHLPKAALVPPKAAVSFYLVATSWWLIFVRHRCAHRRNLRWHCLQRLAEEEGPAVLHEERRYMEEIASDNAKNYQLWNHRRKCAMAVGAAGKHEEMKFTADVRELMGCACGMGTAIVTWE